ncbi:phosphoglucomutase/phosphomannomutase PgmG [Roseiterribacter gracilis]|uniref:Phosphomannomutase n=1 Tax=Roseiterribacter gracilis TaxID=2812848 RepID=A0A8S8X5Z1_9PROT|nr:phosphomannomutase [Rhodospirillales bacterium TMPK1]
MTAHDFHPTVLREYDIRGIVDQTLSTKDATAIGRAFGTMVGGAGKTICLGYDGRLSSPSLAAALAEGLLSTGVNVKRVGLGPTPMLYFAVKHLQADAGIMVTGSHNPSDYNGFKMTLYTGPVFGEEILKLGKVAASGKFATGKGEIEDLDIQDVYVERLLKDYEGPRDLKVVWDAGNGATGEILRRLVKKLPGTHTLLFDDIDGKFPNHHPDPTVEENLVDLKRVVAEKGADLGIGFDGDGDRIGAIDGKGRVVWGDQLLAIYATEVLVTHPGAMIIADVKASQVLFDEIKRLGGQPLMWKTGHSLLKAKMAETGSPLAGEMSGHIFFGDKWYGFDDALYCGVRLLSLVSKSGKQLADLVDTLPKVFNTPETRFQVDESRKFEVVKEVKQRLLDAKVEVNDIDGVRVKTDDGWWLLRASNTQDVLVARCEASSEAGLDRLKKLLTAQLKQSGINAPANF